MLGIIFIIYIVALFCYWGARAAEAVPTLLKGALLLLALPVLLPVAMVKSLPHYLKKEGKWYKWRWVVYLNIVAWVSLLILVCLPK